MRKVNPLSNFKEPYVIFNVEQQNLVRSLKSPSPCSKRLLSPHIDFQLLKPLAISVGSVYTSVFLFRHFLKFFYFSYKGYLFENTKKPSIRTIIWGVLRKVLLAVAPPQLSSCDRLLPNLPLPALQDTVDRYMDSMKHLMPEVRKHSDESKNEFGEHSSYNRFLKSKHLYLRLFSKHDDDTFLKYTLPETSTD